MTKKQIIREIKNRIKYLDGMEVRMGKQVDAIEGTITIDRAKGTRFLHCIKGKRRVYLGQKDEAKIVKLAQKRYAEKCIAVGVVERRQLDQCIHVLESGPEGQTDVSDVFGSMPVELKPFIRKSVDREDEEYAKAWQDRKLSKWIRDEFTETIDPLKTKRGEFVRSKSELIIADKLYDAGVPYFYEIRKDVPGSREHFYPDFLVLNKRTRKEYIWEHLGLMDKADYMRANQRKLSEYAKMGFFQGKNMIITFEGTSVPLDTEYVESLIEEFLK